MVMARTSRADPGAEPTVLGATVGPSPAPTPLPVASGEGVPAELPEITVSGDLPSGPAGGLVARRRDLAISVTVPETVLRPRELTLQILHDGEVVQAIARPSPAEEPEPIELAEGPNRLSARLVGPNGPGPTATEIEVFLDTKAPSLSIDSPRDHQPVEGERVTVRGESDPGATVVITNRRTDVGKPLTVGPSGSFEGVVALVPGENEIRIRATDLAGNSEVIDRAVERAGAGVRAKISANPRTLSARALPSQVRVIGKLRDRDDRPVKGARVTFTLTIPGQATVRSEEVLSGPDGTATWKEQVDAEGIETGDAQIALIAQLPTGGRIDAASEDALTIVR
jgi:hypothetical protein